jgi:tetratricopeptide (TPR) repeat protein
MPPFAVLKALVLGAALLTLAACQNSEERAEAHYRSALALLEEGDTVRAALEFRNVFDNNGMHLEARETFAAMLRETGDLQQSYSQYLRLVEQDPLHVRAHVALTMMALQFQNWEEVRRHGTRALELAPDAPEAAAIALNLAYLDALEAEDRLARREVLADVQAQLRTDPDNIFLQRLAIDGQMRDGDFEAALATVDAALGTDPARRPLHDTRLQILAALERHGEVEAQLLEMLRLFPEDRELQGMTLRFYVARGEIAAAQDFLTGIAETAGAPDLREEALSALMQLRLEYEGPEAAMAEADRIIAAGQGDVSRFRALRASLMFQTGARAEAIAEMEALLEGEMTPVERGQLQVVLARMLQQDGNVVGAQRLVDTVLEADPGQVEALKMRARRLIDRDETDRAIQSLRTALDESPEDAEALTLLASAYARAGNGELAREFLSLAVEASGGAPEETLRFARVLVEDGRHLLAEEVLVRALRLTPGHPGLLTQLGQVYLLVDDRDRAEGVEQALRRLDTEATARAADAIRAELLARQGQASEAIAFLERVAADQAAGGAGGGVEAHVAVIRARLATGDPAGALSYAAELVARTPDDPALKAILATVQNATGRFAEAEAGFRALAEAEPRLLQAWIGLMRAQRGQGEAEAARATLDEALSHLPDAPDLLWAQASFLDREGDFEGAIAIYERLYETMSASAVVANNLASLISTHRDDAESLERAWLIARRLQGSEVPAFQDTYGWIAHRRGQHDEALAHLEPAAAGLPDDPLVQYHLGMAYLAVDRPGDALEQLRRAVTLAGPDDPRPQFDRARQEIARLEAGAGSEAAPASGGDANQGGAEAGTQDGAQDGAAPE